MATSYFKYILCCVAIVLFLSCLYFATTSSLRPFDSRTTNQTNVFPIIPVVGTPWHNIRNETLMWHIAHYEHRHFAYGAPGAIILMLFHYHLSPLPSLYLKWPTGSGGTKCIDTEWISFGKIVGVKFEVNYLYFAVYKIEENDHIIPDHVHLYDSKSCTENPIIGYIPLYYKHNETQIEVATCLYKGISTTKHVYPFDIVSWIEINRALGVEHITMYDQMLTPEILGMLEKYREEGFVELIDWKIPNPERRIANNGQVATIQDCLYRYLRRAKYIVFVDLDELIVPHQHDNLPEMMSFLSQRHKRVTQFRFYNSFWHFTGEKALGQYITSPNESIPIHFLRTNRTKDCPPTIRHKNIIKVEGAVRIGIHHVYRWKQGEGMYQVPEKVGLMHHYRRPDYAKNEEQVEDMIMSKFAPQVMTRLKKLYN